MTEARDTLTVTTSSTLCDLVDELERQKEAHDAASLAISQTLDDLRKRLASASGARAGKNARSGKRRKPKDKALPFESSASVDGATM